MDWQPRAVVSLHAVAVNTNLQKNEGRPFLSFQTPIYVLLIHERSIETVVNKSL